MIWTLLNVLSRLESLVGNELHEDGRFQGRSLASSYPSPALVRYLNGETNYEECFQAVTEEERLVLRSPVKVAVVGCGRHSRSALQPNLARLPSFDLVGVCDTDQSVVSDCARRFGARAEYLDVGRMLDECRPEAVVVVGTPQMHYDIGLEVAASGANVFVEKPPAPDSVRAGQLAECALASGSAGMVGTMLRHTTAVRLVRDLIDGGDFGDRLFFSGRLFAPGPTSDDYYRLGSVPQAYLGAQAIHLLDCMRFLMGDTREVSARLGIAGDAFSFAVNFDFLNGAVGTLSLATHTRALEMEIVVGGSGGQVAIAANVNHLRVLGSPVFRNSLGGYVDVPSKGWDQGYTYAGTLRHGYLEELHSFAVSTRSMIPIGPTLSDGVVALQMCEAIWDSCNSRKPVYLANPQSLKVANETSLGREV